MPKTERKPLPSGFGTLRDIICFVLGVGIIGHEVFFQPSVETAAVGVGVALCGLPLVLGADDKRKGAE